jgi:hypothetical protein
MSLLQEIKKYGLADCEFNRSLLKKQYVVLFMGENVWTINGEPMTFNSFDEALESLEETFTELESENIDYEPSDYRITEID